MADFKLSAAEIVSILEACRDSRVAEFNYGPLSVRFDLPVVPETIIRMETLPSPAVTNQTEPDHEKNSLDALARDEILAREQQIAELTVTDPLAAEEMIIRGELTLGGPGIDEDSHD